MIDSLIDTAGVQSLPDQGADFRLTKLDCLTHRRGNSSIKFSQSLVVGQHATHEDRTMKDIKL
jgi:hypothetical protein